MKENIRGRLLAPIIALLLILAVFTTIIGNVTGALTFSATNIQTPAQDETWISGTYNITWTAATGNEGTVYYNVYIENSTQTLLTNTTNLYYEWDTTAVSDGFYWINITALDSGNWSNTSTAKRSVIVVNTFHITAPTDGSWYTGCNATNITITWTAAANATNYTVVVKYGNTGVFSTTVTGTTAYWEPDNYNYGDGDYKIYVYANNNSLTPSTINASNNGITVAIKIPGVSIWKSDEIVNPTSDFEVGKDIKVKLQNMPNTTYWKLYKPSYGGAKLTWEEAIEGNYIEISGGTGEFPTVYSADVAGLWIVVNYTGEVANFSDFKFFWVNASTPYTLELEKTTIKYGFTGNITATVKEGDSAVEGAWVDMRDSDGTLISRDITGSGGTVEFNMTSILSSNYVGNYTFVAYKDTDVPSTSYGNVGYTTGYGSHSATFSRTNYSYAVHGPYDPPEKNSTSVTFKVETDTPEITLSNTTVYWSFPDRIDVNVTDHEGKGITGATIKIKNSAGTYFGNGSYNLSITEVGNGNYTIIFPPEAANWTHLGVNSTKWYVVVSYDIDNDTTEEWNGTARFTVSKAPTIRMQLINYVNKKIDVPAYSVSGNEYNVGKVNIKFRVLSNTYNNNFTDSSNGNITVTGDLLYPATYYYDSSNRYWQVNVTPTKGGGSITIKVDWDDINASVSETFTVVNGTVITVQPTEFTVDQNVTIDITVKDKNGVALPYATVVLFWNKTGTNILNSTSLPIQGDGTTGKGANGLYTFTLTTDDQINQAPIYINVAVKNSFGTGYMYGYAKLKMDARHDIQVNVTPTSVMAGKLTEYTVNISLVGGGYPDTTGLTAKIYNETGSVTGNIIPSTGDKLNFTFTSPTDYDITAADTYHIFVYNSTHDSKGYNATIVVTPVTVTCQPSVLVNKIDTNVSVTFTVTWNGQPVGNGTLKIINMTYNATTGRNDTVNDTTKYIEVELTNGTVTIYNINATELCNLVFEYKPEASGSVYAKADGSLPVKTAKAILSPATIYIGAEVMSYPVTITIVNPLTNESISGVYVSLNTTILQVLPQGGTTDKDGIITFVITPTTTGKIYVEIQNVTSEYYIDVKAVSTLSIAVSSPSVSEGEQFTVTATSGGTAVSGVTVTVIGTNLSGTTGTDGTITFTAPDIATTATYTITGTKEGYTTATTYIQIVNLPQLIVTVDKTIVTEGEKFIVTVTAGGNMISGATVTLNGVTKYTTAGTATFTAPEVDKDTTYTITATLTGYKQGSTTITIKNKAGVPGFELITLIAALGVALILLRRRR
jgi:hypothetical protein